MRIRGVCCWSPNRQHGGGGGGRRYRLEKETKKGTIKDPLPQYGLQDLKSFCHICPLSEISRKCFCEPQKLSILKQAISDFWTEFLPSWLTDNFSALLALLRCACEHDILFPRECTVLATQMCTLLYLPPFFYNRNTQKSVVAKKTKTYKSEAWPIL